MVTQQATSHQQGISAPAFVGRGWHLDALAGALAQPPAVVLVEGEAGIGKSRLVREFLTSPDGRRHRPLVGVCPPYREPSTLAPVVDALRPAGERVAELGLSGLGGALRPLFPEWVADLPPSPEPLGDPEATRHRLYRALAELTGRLGVTVLVLEDLHWADTGSLEFLLFLATRQQATREPAGGGLSLVVTYRPEDVPEGSLLLRLSSRLPPGVTRLRLAPPLLGVADTAALVSSMLDGAEVSETFAAFLLERTAGLPLAIEESVRLLGDRADLVHRNGEWVRSSLQGLQVPPTVRDSTLERVQRQPRSARRVLQAAAVVAAPADEATLAAVAGLAAPAARAAVTRAVAVGLLHERGEGTDRGRLAFRHPLSATAVYESIPGPERRRLHLRAGHALARQDPPPAAGLARHFREGGDVASWARWAEWAADAATASSDHAAATALLEDLPAAAVLPSRVRLRLAKKLATAALYLQAADGDQSDRVVATVRGVLRVPGPGTRDRAELRNLLGRLLNQRGEPAAAFAELARTIPHLGHAPVEVARSMISLGWPRAGSWPAAVHLRWLRRADRLPTASMSPADRLSLRVDRATALLQLGAEAGWAVAADLPETAPTPEERLHLARGYLNIGDAALHWGHYRHSRRLLATGLGVARTNQFARLEEIILSTLTRLDWLTGAWDGLAERVAAMVGSTEAPGRREEAVLVSGLVQAARGDHDRAARHLRAFLEEARRHGSVTLQLTPAAALARLELAAGRVAAARAVTDDPMDTVTRKKIWVWATDIAPVRVAVLLRTGPAEPAERLVAAFGAGIRGRDAPAPRAALATCRAILAAHRGDHRQAAARYAGVARAWDALPRPYAAWLAREQRGHSLLAAGREEAGLAELGQVLAGLRELGATGDAERVAGALRERGLGVAEPWRGGRRGYGDQLSPRERDVVALVVTGKTNREIAKLLSKAPGTVAEQLRSAMRKLGVSSRTALAVRAIERGGLGGSGGVPDQRELGDRSGKDDEIAG